MRSLAQASSLSVMTPALAAHGCTTWQNCSVHTQPRGYITKTMSHIPGIQASVQPPLLTAVANAPLVPRMRASWRLQLSAVAVVAILLSCGQAWASIELETELGDRLGHLLRDGSSRGMVLAYLISFLAGLATSLTPCVYPLIPITVSLFGAGQSQHNRARSLFLASCYVGGIAAMYSGLGVLFGLMGWRFGSFMANPFVVVPIAVFFLAMAASMFGAFELALPSSLQNRLSRVGGKGPLGAFLMGLVAGIIAAPCTGPPLAALLVFVGTSRSVTLGGSLLFVYALGLGVLFFVLAGFALRLPRSGPWMESVKSAFGIIMVVAALYFLRNVLSPLRALGSDKTSVILFDGFLIATGILVGALRYSFHDGPRKVVQKLVGVLISIIGLFGIVSCFLTTTVQLSWINNEQAALTAAREQKKPLLVDFGAEWCLPCKEMEKKTFSDPRIRQELSRYVLLRIDCTDSTDENQALQDKYNSNTLPSVILFGSDGKQAFKFSEFTSPDKMLPILQRTQ